MNVKFLNDKLSTNRYVQKDFLLLFRDDIHVRVII